MTIEAPAAGSTALVAHAMEAGRKLTVNTFNTITRGAGDIKAETDSTAGTAATVNVSRGNWSISSLEGAQTAVNDDGTKQTAPPVFVNAAAGDFREAETSPTIDAGADASANGTSDFEGDPRIAGLRTDIGADEFETNPAASTAGATSVTVTTATLNGAVNPNTIATSYHFEFGRTVAYGQSTAQTPAGPVLQSASAVSAAIAGLAPAASYHARLVATNAGGTVAGNDITFTTLAPLPLLPAAPARPTVSGAHLTNKRFRIARQNTAISARGSLGTIFRFALSAGAKVEIAITRPAPGLHHGHGCVAPTAKLRHSHAKRCTRALTVGTLTRAKESQGPDSVSFSGRIGHRALRPLAYRAILSASDAGGRSAPVTLAFAVLPAK